MDESLILVDESLILVSESLILVDESLILVSESLILVDESFILVDESFILVDKSLILARESLILVDESLMLVNADRLPLVEIKLHSQSQITNCKVVIILITACNLQPCFKHGHNSPPPQQAFSLYRLCFSLHPFFPFLSALG
ncbi:hypothetical protein [Nostoc sp.]|uniref:hypothetical protein n=1 Tax=Nostoc sp. TaxID=1180 RepID=UPI002FFB0D31